MGKGPELKKSGLMVKQLDNAYVCDKGHWMTSKEDLSDCLVFRKGKPCEGTLKRLGKRKKK